jgi:PAS domain S-box-containing protein
MTGLVTRKSYRHSITSKLTMLMALASGVALLLSCAAFVCNDISMMRQEKIHELSSVAEVLGWNSTAALAFFQQRPAEELLHSLKRRPEIEAAYLFDADRELFASFNRLTEPAAPPACPDFTGHAFLKDGFLDVVVPIVEDDEALGYIQLRTTIGDLQGQIHRYIAIATGVMMASLLVAVLIGSRLQRFISDPITNLARTIKHVKEDGDYSARVAKPADDEIGELYDEFNGMLERIEVADSALHRAHEELREINAGLEQRVQERTEELEYNENRVRAIVESAGDGIFTTDENGIVQTVNPAVEEIFGYSADKLIGENVTRLLAPEFTNQHLDLLADYDKVRKRDNLGERREVEGVRRDGSCFPMELTVCEASLRDQLVFTGFVRDLTKIKEAQHQLAAVNEQLMDASRTAGMAEVANNVLHNVGNVLNSVNVAAALLHETVRNSEVGDLNRVLAIIDDHQSDLSEFIGNDPRGRHLPQYLVEAGRTLEREQDTVLDKLVSVTKNIDHIKDIVAAQQSYAGMSGVEQMCELNELMDDALHINSGALVRHCIEVEREYDDLPPICVDKQKVMQILINLIGNAKHAIRDGGRTGGRIHMQVVGEEEWVRMEVVDDGVGILPENLERVFRHGFTTKEDGHGFGLHSAALAAKEMGGSLVANSDGPGTGATFSLKLPLTRQRVPA